MKPTQICKFRQLQLNNKLINVKSTQLLQEFTQHVVINEDNVGTSEVIRIMHKAVFFTAHESQKSSISNS